MANYTTTLTSKNQLTLPNGVRDAIGATKGMKFDIFPTKDGFVGKVKRKSNILAYAGSLAHLDDGRPWSDIREEAHAAAAKEIVSKWEKYAKKK